MTTTAAAPTWTLIMARTTELINLEMMASEESTYGLILTLHRWNKEDGSDRQVWSLRVEEGKPVLELVRNGDGELPNMTNDDV